MYGYNTHGSESQATCRNIWALFSEMFYLAISYLCTMYLDPILTQLPSNYPYTPQYVPLSSLYLIAIFNDSLNLVSAAFMNMDSVLVSTFQKKNDSPSWSHQQLEVEPLRPSSVLELLTRTQVLAFHSEELTHRHIVRNRNRRSGWQ